MTGKIPINLTLEPAVDIIYIPELKLQNHNYKKTVLGPIRNNSEHVVNPCI